ncbi:MAG: Chromosome partition protein Smc [Planctomycetota bacterium]|jgi:TolA-binding protein
MTQLGKILVVVITILAMVFLGLSTVVFMTADNWKEKAIAESTKLKDTQGQLNSAEEEVARVKTELQRLDQEKSDLIAQKDQELRDLNGRMTILEGDLTQVRKELSVAQATATLSSTESVARVDETGALRESLKSAQDQANSLKIQEKDLNQRIVELNKSLETAQNINKNLREQVATLSSTLSKAGLAADVRNVTSLANPPEVEGQVARVDATASRIEISIGSDDGLVNGHELFVYRRTPRPQYIGKIRIIATDPERSVATVIGKTYLGTKVTEGDIVSTTIKPRS